MTNGSRPGLRKRPPGPKGRLGHPGRLPGEWQRGPSGTGERFDQIELRLKQRQQRVGQHGAGVGHADVVADDEIGDADGVAPLLHGEGAIVDLLANLRRIPRGLGVLQGSQGVVLPKRIVPSEAAEVT